MIAIIVKNTTLYEFLCGLAAIIISAAWFWLGS